MTQPQWQRVSVQQFLSEFNWKGLSLISDKGPADALEERPWQCLSVQEFLLISNWKGRSLEYKNLEKEGVAFSLTVTVNQFFQYFAWNRQPQIAVVPQLETRQKSSPSLDSHPTLSDLSNLF
jgi:hypothetical protein